MKKKCKVKVMEKVLWGFLLGVILLTIVLVYTPVRAKLSHYNPQGLKAATLEEVLALPDEEIDLATAILILYKEWDAGLDVTGSLEEIERMVLDLQVRISPEDNPERIVSLINEYLFEEKGYSSLVLDPSDPGYWKLERCALPRVIENRKGDCFGLSLFYLALTERLRLPFYGVEVPGHIFVRYDDGKKKINIETLEKGKEYEDSYYEKSYMLHPTYRNYNFYLRNLLKRELIGLVLNNIGNAYERKGMYDEAIAEFKRAIEINLNYANPHLNLGLAYYEKGMFDEAIAEYKRAIEINPNYTEAHNNLGNTYNMKGMFDEAIAEYKRAIEINPNLAEAHSNLGVAYDGKGMYDEAIAEYKRAIEINSNYAKAHYNLGNTYSMKEMFDEAIAEYKRAIEINPNDAGVHNNLAVAYYYKGEYSLAIKHCDIAIELGYKVHPKLLELLDPHRKR